MVEDFRFTHEGRSYRCWDQSGGVSTVPLEIAPTVICNAHWFVEVDGNQHRLFEASYDDRQTPGHEARLRRRIIDAVAGIETRAQKSVHCYEFCYGEEREAETKVPPSAQLSDNAFPSRSLQLIEPGLRLAVRSAARSRLIRPFSRANCQASTGQFELVQMI